MTYIQTERQTDRGEIERQRVRQADRQTREADEADRRKKDR